MEALGISAHVKELGEPPGSPVQPGASVSGRSKQVTQMRSLLLGVEQGNALDLGVGKGLVLRWCCELWEVHADMTADGRWSPRSVLEIQCHPVAQRWCLQIPP